MICVLESAALRLLRSVSTPLLISVLLYSPPSQSCLPLYFFSVLHLIWKHCFLYFPWARRIKTFSFLWSLISMEYFHDPSWLFYPLTDWSFDWVSIIGMMTWYSVDIILKYFNNIMEMIVIARWILFYEITYVISLILFLWSGHAWNI